MPPVAIGVDIGGTKISAGVVDDGGTILERAELPSDIDDAESVRRQLAALVQTLKTPEVRGLGIGAAGIVDHRTGYYLFGPNTGLREMNLADEATNATGLQVRVDNDANCAAWAEHRFGVGRDCLHFMCVTLGTGIGGGLVLNGRPYREARGGAAEIGHMLVDPDGPVCGCGRRGCWEQFASGRALERMAREEIGEHPESALNQHVREGHVAGPAITAAVREGDAFASELVERMATWIGWGLGSLANILEPERIAIAGGIARDWDLFAPTAARALTERMEASDARPAPELLAAELEHDAGIVGAALLILDAPD